MSHTLVIGGTGMLREVSVWLSTQYNVVSVIARSGDRIARIAREVSVNGGLVNPLALNYQDGVGLQIALEKAVREHGEISLVVSWIHSVAPDAHRVVAELLNTQDQPCAWFDVLGSAVANPSASVPDRKAEFSLWKKLLYRSVVLGFIIEDAGSRWLTQSEISTGVIQAIEEGSQSAVVGQVRPWERRP